MKPVRNIWSICAGRTVLPAPNVEVLVSLTGFLSERRLFCGAELVTRMFRLQRLPS